MHSYPDALFKYLNWNWKTSICCLFRSSFKFSSALWIDCCNLIFLTLLVKALTSVASSCNSESHYLANTYACTHMRTHTHTHTKRLFVCTVLLILTVSYLEGYQQGAVLEAWGQLLSCWHFTPFFVSRCYGWEVPVSVSFLMGLALAPPYLPHYQLQLQMAQRCMT